MPMLSSLELEEYLFGHDGKKVISFTFGWENLVAS